MILDIWLPPAPAQRVAAEEGSQKDGPVTIPLAQLQFSKSGFGLFGWILERAVRGALVYGRIGGIVEAGTKMLHSPGLAPSG